MRDRQAPSLMTPMVALAWAILAGEGDTLELAQTLAELILDAAGEHDLAEPS